jgi:hypothetical protein
MSDEMKTISIETPPEDAKPYCVVCMTTQVAFEDLLVCETAEEARLQVGKVPVATRHALCEDCLSNMQTDECPICKRKLRGRLVTKEILDKIKARMDAKMAKAEDYSRYQPIYRDYPNFNLSRDYFGRDPKEILSDIDEELSKMVADLDINIARYPRMLPREITATIIREGRVRK